MMDTEEVKTRKKRNWESAKRDESFPSLPKIVIPKIRKAVDEFFAQSDLKSGF